MQGEGSGSTSAHGEGVYADQEQRISQDTAHPRSTAHSQSTAHPRSSAGGVLDPDPIGRIRIPQVIIWQGAPPDRAHGQPSAALSDPGDSEGVATAEPKRKREHKTHGPATRTSRRIQGKDPEDDHGNAPKSAVYLTSIRELLATMIRTDNKRSIPENPEAFFSTFWPSMKRVLKNGNDHRTVYVVFVVSVLQNYTMRPSPGIPRIHQSDLPRAPRSWRELEKHPLGEQFRADAVLELQNLEARNCWRVIPRAEAKTQPIPLKWVFVYKTDSSGALVRCRSRIVVRGDLQEDATILSTYATTLAARSFRTAMAITAHFDLEAKQFDVVNTFVNAKRDAQSSPVTC